MFDSFKFFVRMDIESNDKIQAKELIAPPD